MMIKSLLVGIALLVCAAGGASAEDGLYVCVEHVDPGDWDYAFEKGAVVQWCGDHKNYFFEQVQTLRFGAGQSIAFRAMGMDRRNDSRG
jgi:hypothetical protein